MLPWYVPGEAAVGSDQTCYCPSSGDGLSPAHGGGGHQAATESLASRAPAGFGLWKSLHAGSQPWETQNLVRHGPHVGPGETQTGQGTWDSMQIACPFHMLPRHGMGEAGLRLWPEIRVPGRVEGGETPRTLKGLSPQAPPRPPPSLGPASLTSRTCPLQAPFPREDIAYAALSLGDNENQEATYSNMGDLLAHDPSRSHEEPTEYSAVKKA